MYPDNMPKFRIGTGDFKKLRDQNGYFVDKPLLIKEIIEGNKVILGSPAPGGLARP